MYCPNCGVEIHLEGSYCAKCRKDVAYLTQNNKPSSDSPASPILPEDPTVASPVQQDGRPQTLTSIESILSDEREYYCNFCGTTVFSVDNYCYACGKKTRKQYYLEEKQSKKPYMITGLVLLAAAAAIAAYLLW